MATPILNGTDISHLKMLPSLLQAHKTVILAGTFGTEMTSQIPQLLLDADLPQIQHARIACTQTRRRVARATAQQVASDRGVSLGEDIGYSIRFDDCTSQKTILTYLTDGVLLRAATVDPLLSRYSVIILDNVAERSLNTDVLMTLLKTISKSRSDLRIVIMGVDRDAERLRTYFDDAAMLLGTVPSQLPPGENSAIPDILRTDLTSTVLLLKKLGIDDLPNFDFLDRPPPEVLMRALEHLHRLQAIDDDGKLTAIGDAMARFPVDPSLSRAILAGPTHGCTNDILSIVAILSVPRPYLPPTGTTVDETVVVETEPRHRYDEHFALLDVFRAYKKNLALPDRASRHHHLSKEILAHTDAIRSQLRSYMPSTLLSEVDKDEHASSTAIGMALAEGLVAPITC
ncbi:hypothetical protein HKX48_008969 [Thoreauomyces humboldtii]|nr:hypothetical protein HKX48_008969 [Thoreauomyces humboldtii]